MPVKITTESSSDLSDKMLAEFDVTVLPMNIIIGSRQYEDGVDMTSRRLLETKETAKTAAISEEKYRSVFSSLKRDGFDVVHVALSSEISATCQNAVNAARELEGVYVVDSLSLSAGAGLLCIIGAQLAEAGESAVDIVKTLEKDREKIKTSFILEDLERIKRGGRCTAIEVLGANLLGIKPSIEMVGGKLTPSGRYHGRGPAARLKYIDSRIESDNPDRTVCFLNHTLESDSETEELIDLLKTKYGFERVFENRAGCCISAHCGKNCMGIIYMT
ncbi:MAG: DegV family protein [Oscillospiraceae bacterium]|nr:DegV family protein [Oscillospiraceae bacterium]